MATNRELLVAVANLKDEKYSYNFLPAEGQQSLV